MLVRNLFAICSPRITQRWSHNGRIRLVVQRKQNRVKVEVKVPSVERVTSEDVNQSVSITFPCHCYSPICFLEKWASTQCLTWLKLWTRRGTCSRWKRKRKNGQSSSPMRVLQLNSTQLNLTQLNNASICSVLLCSSDCLCIHDLCVHPSKHQAFILQVGMLEYNRILALHATLRHSLDQLAKHCRNLHPQHSCQ